MREILFRGKPKNLKKYKWVQGQLLHHRDNLSVIYSEEADHPVGVMPETVGQFTGLTDKNGKRIFEGDIVRFAERRLGGEVVSIVEPVAFDEGGFCTHRYFLNNWMRSGNTKLEDIEVIGNIHDNPELLGDAE